MLIFWSMSVTHVPTYGTCANNCCVPPRIHTISQVIYLQGEGGLELHIDSDTSPFNIANAEIINADAVFRDEIDQSTYDLYIGCGGCGSNDALLPQSKISLFGYQPLEIEPFTQTAYRSVFPKNERTFNSKNLESLQCPGRHFTIRLIDYKNRTDSSDIIWGPVIGLDESFTLVELLEFPLYILRNHGYMWNDLGYTYWIWLFIGTPLIINLCRSLLFILCRSKYRILTPFRQNVQAREILYEFAIIGFSAAGFEELTHLLYVQIGNPVGYGLYVGLFVIIIFTQGISLLFTCVVWNSMYHRKDHWIISNPLWAPLEIATGFSFLFLFGAGFYVGPVAIMIAGVVRLTELRGHARHTIPIHRPKPRTQFKTETGMTFGFTGNIQR